MLLQSTIFTEIELSCILKRKRESVGLLSPLSTLVTPPTGPDDKSISTTKMEALNSKPKTELQLLQLTQSKTQGIVDKREFGQDTLLQRSFG